MRRYRVKRKEEKTINDVFIVYSSLYAFSKRQKTVFFTFPLFFFFQKKKYDFIFHGVVALSLYGVLLDRLISRERVNLIGKILVKKISHLRLDCGLGQYLF